jgi:hypothetical protein
MYLLGGAPAGVWSGYAYKIAYCIDGTWRFFAPFNGLRAFVAPSNAFIVYDAGTWADANALISAHEVSIASAATSDLGAAASLFVQMTGSTTITSFGAAANLLRFVRFAGALTLTQNATSLKLLCGSDRLTQAGDSGLYASDSSGNWREISYGGPAPLLGAGGVKFPASQIASSDPNTLDDYEEGSFAPTLYGAGVAGSMAYTVQIGRYEKIGRQVSVRLWVAGTLSGAGGDLMLGGLPYALSSDVLVTGPIANYGGLTLDSGYSQLSLQLTSGASHGQFVESGSGRAAAALTLANVSGALQVIASATYHV